MVSPGRALISAVCRSPPAGTVMVLPLGAYAGISARHAAPNSLSIWTRSTRHLIAIAVPRVLPQHAQSPPNGAEACVRQTAELFPKWRAEPCVAGRHAWNPYCTDPATQMSAERSDRIPSLDGLRAISIAMVLSAHLAGT